MRRKIGNIANDGFGSDSFRSQLADRVFDFTVDARRVHADGEPFGGERERDPFADAAARSGNKRRVAAHMRAPFFRSSRAMTVL